MRKEGMEEGREKGWYEVGKEGEREGGKEDEREEGKEAFWLTCFPIALMLYPAPAHASGSTALSGE